jgi:MFS family permease
VISSRPPLQLPRGIFYGWVIVAVSFMGNWITAPLNPVVFSIFIVPIRDDLKISLSTLAWCITVRMVSAGISAPILGHLVDRVGARWLGVGCATWAGTCLVALSFASNVWVMYALFFISGFSGFGVFGGGQILTGVPPANWFIAKRGRAVSYAMAGGGLGTASWVAISAFLVSTIGWRAAWFAYGLMIIAVLVPAYGFLMRRRPEDVGLYPDGASAPQQGVPATDGRAAEINFTREEAMRTSVLWLAIGAFTVYTFATNAILFLRVPFWSDLGIAAGVIGIAVATDPFVVMLCTLQFGFVAERFPVRFITASGGLFRAASMLVLVLTLPYAAWVFAHNILWGVGSAGMATGQNLLIPQYFGRLAQGAIRGFTAPIMIGAGAMSPPFVGYLLDAGVANTTVFAIAGGIMLAAGAVFPFLKQPHAPVRLAAAPVEATLEAVVGGRP